MERQEDSLAMVRAALRPSLRFLKKHALQAIAVKADSLDKKLSEIAKMPVDDAKALSICAAQESPESRVARICEGVRNAVSHASNDDFLRAERCASYSMSVVIEEIEQN